MSIWKHPVFQNPRQVCSGILAGVSIVNVMSHFWGKFIKEKQLGDTWKVRRTYRL